MDLDELRQRLELANTIEAYVAHRLSCHGIPVMFPGLRVATSEAEARKKSLWKGVPDLILYPEDKKILIEIKSQSKKFTDAESFRKSWRSSSIPICSKGSYQKDRAYLFVSKWTGAILWIPIGVPAEELTTSDFHRRSLYKTMNFNAKDLLPFGSFLSAVKSDNWQQELSYEFRNQVR